MIVNILSSPMQQYLGACRLFPKQLSDSSHQSGNHTDSLSNRISVDAKLQTMNITRRQPKYCASICIVGYVPCGSFRSLLHGKPMLSIAKKTSPLFYRPQNHNQRASIHSFIYVKGKLYANTTTNSLRAKFLSARP